MSETDLHPVTCPHCGAVSDDVTNLNGTRAPKPGDRTLCAYCLGPSVYVAVGGALALRELTEAEAADPEWAAQLKRVVAHAKASGLPLSRREGETPRQPPMSPVAREGDDGHPLLGMPMDMLTELASVDWHAGHPEHPHEGPRPIGVPCRCADPDVLGEFAVRLVTGQAQASSTRDGRGVLMLNLGEGGQRHARLPATPDGVLAALRVEGSYAMVDCTDCANTDPHQRARAHVTGASVGGAEAIEYGDCLNLLIEATTRLAAQYVEAGGDPADLGIALEGPDGSDS